VSQIWFVWSSVSEAVEELEDMGVCNVGAGMVIAVRPKLGQLW
jgi:hypothetical protein